MVKQRSTGRRYTGLLALGLALLPVATAAGAAELAGSEWRPVRLGATDVAADTKAFVQFKSGGELAGQGGCNRFFGRYRIEGETIRFAHPTTLPPASRPASTRISAMGRYWSWLKSSSRVQVTFTGLSSALEVLIAWIT